MKKYKKSLKRAAAFALSTILVASGVAVSADDFTSYEEDAVFTENPSFGNEDADFPSADEVVFDDVNMYSEATGFVSEEGAVQFYG